ncbi:MAG TPA: cellulose biosynthesis protein BcsG, partial [Gallionella sp.]|nr:cellulose biosynthesis protein BcsG [Gallionella sp.]
MPVRLQESQVDRFTEKELPNWSAYVRRLGGQAPQSVSPDARLSRFSGFAKNLVPVGAKVTLGGWSYYFIAKLALFVMGVIAFHTLENLAFAAFILWFAACRFRHGVKTAVIAALALALLYYDSWLPPINRLFSQASLLSNFSFAYFVELLARFINWSVIGALLVIWVLYRLAARRLRVGALVVASMVAVGLLQHWPTGNAANKTMPDMNKVLQDFFSAEAQRSVVFSQPQA